MNNQNLKLQAQKLASKGRGRDKILAHINPMEAMQLSQQYGGSINPATGLPQFGGLFYSIDRAFGRPSNKKVEEQKRAGTWKGSPLAKAMKYAYPIMGSILGGPIGAGVGGMLGPKNRRMGPLGGAAFGTMATMGLDGISGGNNRMSNGLSGLLGQSGGQGGSSGGGMLDGIGSMFGGSGLNALLAGIAGYGMLKGKHKMVGGESPAETASRIRKLQRESWGKQHDPYTVKPLDRNYINPVGAEGDPRYSGEHKFFEDINPPVETYAQGGYVDGDSGGQDDTVPTHLPDGSFVMNAMDTSLLGDGNSLNGKKRLHHFEDVILKDKRGTHEIMRGNAKGGKPNALVSGGEYTIRPATVAALGGGNLNKGEKQMTKFVKNLRTQKGVKKRLLPKTKNVFDYLKG